MLDGFQTTPATQTAIVSVLTHEQRLMNDRLSVESGRTNAYNHFLLPNSLDPTWYVQSGAFEDNYRYATGYGDRFGTDLSSDAQLLAEIGQRSDLTNSAYSCNLEAGFEWNTRTGRTNLKGTGAPAIPLLQRANYPGDGVIFLQGEKVVWRGTRREVGPPRNIAI